MFFSRKFTLGMFQRSVQNFCPKWGKKCPKIKRPKFFASNVYNFYKFRKYSSQLPIIIGFISSW